jgi:hypothetical protein
MEHQNQQHGGEIVEKKVKNRFLKETPTEKDGKKIRFLLPPAVFSLSFLLFAETSDFLVA